MILSYSFIIRIDHTIITVKNNCLIIVFLNITKSLIYEYIIEINIP